MSGGKQNKKVKKPWPTKDAMEQIYDKKLWGGAGFDFYSGSGSHDLKLTEPYIKVVSSFLKSFKEPLTVCDLGCGDFNVGKELVADTKKYIALDIVAPLIQRNQRLFRHEKLTFICSNIAEGDLPDGECALIRQVLQHLSNAEVKQVLSKLRKYQYIILTEHVPEGAFVPNKDIISGQGIRLKKRSGLDLLAEPFLFQVKETKQWLNIPLENNKGRVVTTVYQLF